MITSLQITNGHLQTILPNKIIQFTDGLNYLLGKNGSGKSMIINTIAIQTYINGVGGSTTNTVPYNFSNEKLPSRIYRNGYYPLNLEWDFASCFFIDANFLFGNISYEMSSGKRIKELPSLLTMLIEGKSNGERAKLIYEALLNLDIKQLVDFDVPHSKKEWSDYIKNKTPQKQTLLLDEIDNSLDLWEQKHFHEILLPELSKKFQIICISHSIFATKADSVIWLSEPISF